MSPLTCLTTTLIALLAYSVSGLPAPESTNNAFQWQIYKACPQENRDKTVRAWEDSKRLADALNSWKPGEDYQAAMEMYMGDRCTYEDYSGYNFKRQIQDTSRRSRGLYDGKSESGHAYLWVYCNEDSFWFKHCASDPKLGVIVAYENEDLFFNNWYITMCPSFYDSRYIIPLDDLIETFKKEFIDPNVMENWDLGPGSSAALLYHETMHLSQLVTSPQAEDKAYGAKGVYELARQSNTDYAVYNADSWKMAATAIFAQQTFNLASPPHPLAYPPADATTGKVKEGNADSLRSEVFNVTDFTPEGAGVREQGQPFKVDTNLWEIYQPKSDGGKPPACKEPLPMNDCVNKNGKCFCKPKVCMVGADCYTIEAKNCDAECKGCQYPMEGSC